ncbi:MAG: aquaporin [Actinobacteria bacterium]|nr:aquaporin [Actinomycetota bacterium]
MTPARPTLGRRCLAEALATFALVFAGCGAIVVDAERGGSLGSVGIAACFGLVIMAMIYATGHLSGAHLNPAVTVAFAVTRHLPLRDAGGYVGAQLAGAVLGALALRLAWDGTPAELGATVPTLGAGPALAYEVVLTALLMFVIMAIATDTRAVGAAAAIAIGGTVALGSLVGGGVSAASLNPARSFGPAVASSTWTEFWVYVAGPSAGALIGALLYQLVRGTEP